jgi:hypothetical protein
VIHNKGDASPVTPPVTRFSITSCGTAPFAFLESVHYHEQTMNNDIPHRKTWVPSNPEERRLVSAALEEILGSTPFRGSRRYPAMLQYIVETTLSDQHQSLKERSIGMEVFGRDPSYDTNADPVVRFSAGEIRRRIAQFYQESGTSSPVMIELPTGTYVPRFYRILPDEPSETIETPDPHASDKSAILPRVAPATVTTPWSVSRRRSLYALGVILILGLVLVGFWRRPKASQSNPVYEVWAPLLNTSDQVLISTGQPLADEESPAPANISIQNHIMRPEFRVSVTTLDAIANIVSYLKSNGKSFRIHEADSDTLADLHDRAVVLVTGNNNKWTEFLLRTLRFHLVLHDEFSYIEDAQNPNFRGWNVDFSKSFENQTTDYAIIARFYSATTGAPVIVAAGISSNGTEAAGEFIVSPEGLAKLKKLAPNGNLNLNFDAVLKVEVVGGNTGAATIVASQFW